MICEQNEERAKEGFATLLGSRTQGGPGRKGQSKETLPM